VTWGTANLVAFNNLYVNDGARVHAVAPLRNVSCYNITTAPRRQLTLPRSVPGWNADRFVESVPGSLDSHFSMS